MITGVMFCLICESNPQSWKSYGIPKKMGKCPECGSKPRSRSIGLFLKKIWSPNSDKIRKVLEIGATRVSLKYLWDSKFIGEAHYTAADIRPLKHHSHLKLPHRFIQMSATDLKFESDSFDLVLCNNVFQFIRDDVQALREIRRVLKADGLAMINVAIEQEKTLTKKQMESVYPHLDEGFFIENGTEWFYGNDYLNRVLSSGLHPIRIEPFAELSENRLKLHGLKRNQDFVFAASHPNFFPPKDWSDLV